MIRGLDRERRSADTCASSSRPAATPSSRSGRPLASWRRSSACSSGPCACRSRIVEDRRARAAAPAATPGPAARRRDDVAPVNTPTRTRPRQRRPRDRRGAGPPRRCRRRAVTSLTRIYTAETARNGRRSHALRSPCCWRRRARCSSAAAGVRRVVAPSLRPRHVRPGHPRRLEHGLPDQRGRGRRVPEGEPGRRASPSASRAPAAASRSSAAARPTSATRRGRSAPARSRRAPRPASRSSSCRSPTTASRSS